jgi:hypothetical protein
MMLGVVLILGLLAIPAVVSAELTAATTLQEQPDLGAKIDVDIDTDEGGAWYTNPLWMAIGGLAVVVLVLLVVMASRGGGTTVVRG